MQLKPGDNNLAPVPAHADGFTWSLLSPVVPLPSLTRHTLLAELPPSLRSPAPDARFIACMVTHGMGQQVPFETVGMVGEAFVKGRAPRSVEANRVQLTQDGELLSRLELIYDTWTDPVTGIRTPETHVHLYEGYWAPLTEGKISFLQTLAFLGSGAWAGILSCIRKLKGKPAFSRWIFGELRQLPIKRGTLWQLLLAVVVLGLAVGLFYLCVHTLQVAWAVLKPLLTQPFTGALKRIWGSLKCHPVSAVLRALLLAGSASYVWLVRYAVIEYVGDVAIYVSSYKVSAYEEVRTAIQAAVFAVGNQIFAATSPCSTLEHVIASADPPNFLYGQVFFLGHSLGSVITYDLLDKLIVWDRSTCGGRCDVLSRTSGLITFGSPLDKTAFLFRTQISPEHHYREALAGVEQPLVLDYRLRPFPWINLYSSRDIISARLIYYDLPPVPGTSRSAQVPAGYNPIDNRADPDAHTWLLAHNQYWAGAMLRTLLQQAIR